MTKKQALKLAEKIAASAYSKNELNAFIAHIRMADPDEMDDILRTYGAAIDKQKGYQLKVGTDFIQRLKNLQPLEETPYPEIPVIPLSKYRRGRFAAAGAILLVILVPPPT